MAGKIVSEKQKQANRRNALNSTGPRTPAGKARSSRNAVTHGLLSNQALILDGDGAEDPNELEVLRDEMFEDLHAAHHVVGARDGVRLQVHHLGVDPGGAGLFDE